MPIITRSGTKPFLPCGRRRRGRSPSSRRNCFVGAPTASVRFDVGSMKSCGTNGFRYTVEGFRQGRAEEGKDPEAARRFYFFLWGFCLVAYLASTRSAVGVPTCGLVLINGETTSEIGLSVN
ncbi:uncharacterized protein LOC125043232 [Penaeus chinensis]|uniref:uncharacterized protein LOC125043232 n=1 Tax=Penaeus chinensis TaxID=139456 RepID=UPI001FB84D36|nr:uncharacterized protein LOC125043232 [Penaeus chinensis]